MITSHFIILCLCDQCTWSVAQVQPMILDNVSPFQGQKFKVQGHISCTKVLLCVHHNSVPIWQICLICEQTASIHPSNTTEHTANAPHSLHSDSEDETTKSPKRSWRRERNVWNNQPTVFEIYFLLVFEEPSQSWYKIVKLYIKYLKKTNKNAWWCTIASLIFINIGSGNGWLLNSTMSVPEPMLTRC